MLAALLLATACGEPGGRAPQTLPAGEWLTFGGTWTAAGTRRTLRLGPSDRAAIFDLTGSVLLTGAQRPAVGFIAHAIGFSDSRSGMQGRCVWTDERGDMVYSELKGQAVAPRRLSQPANGSHSRALGLHQARAGRCAWVRMIARRSST